jgi:hypothetical protein
MSSAVLDSKDKAKKELSMHPSHLRCLAISGMLALAACGDSSDDGAGDGQADLGKALLGTWKSKACEPYGTLNSVRRSYVFTPSDVTIIYDLFAGATCEAGPKVLTTTIHSDVDFLRPSPTVEGATDADFNFRSRAITPTSAGVDFLESACGQYTWVADVEVDITDEGCGELIPSAALCPAEYDLVAIVGDVTYFGDRSTPLCTEEARPTKLGDFGVVKQP